MPNRKKMQRYEHTTEMHGQSIESAKKSYLTVALRQWKTSFCKQKNSFKICKYKIETTLSNYIQKIRDTSNELPSLSWSIIKTVQVYYNVLKRQILCLNEKLTILTNPNQEELFLKRFELIPKCGHANEIFTLHL